jgi:hypothetical protein
MVSLTRRAFSCSTNLIESSPVLSCAGPQEGVKPPKVSVDSVNLQLPRSAAALTWTNDLGKTTVQ